jgi:hypothetical protein
MHIRPGNPGDATAVASLIASFQPILTLEPSGAGAEHYLASVSEDAERQYLEAPRYAYLVAELEGQNGRLCRYAGPDTPLPLVRRRGASAHRHRPRAMGTGATALTASRTDR